MTMIITTTKISSFITYNPRIFVFLKTKLLCLLKRVCELLRLCSAVFGQMKHEYGAFVEWYSEKTCPSFISSAKHSALTRPGTKPGLPGDQPTTNGLGGNLKPNYVVWLYIRKFMFEFLTLKTEAEGVSVSSVRSTNVHNNYILHHTLTTLHIFHTACWQTLQQYV
jgi:hypothetical protein